MTYTSQSVETGGKGFHRGVSSGPLRTAIPNHVDEELQHLFLNLHTCKRSTSVIDLPISVVPQLAGLIDLDWNIDNAASCALGLVDAVSRTGELYHIIYVTPLLLES
jgi:hypothetical protein